MVRSISGNNLAPQSHNSIRIRNIRRVFVDTTPDDVVSVQARLVDDDGAELMAWTDLIEVTPDDFQLVVDPLAALATTSAVTAELKVVALVHGQQVQRVKTLMIVPR